jgi:hypothetical protein
MRVGLILSDPDIAAGFAVLEPGGKCGSEMGR